MDMFNMEIYIYIYIPKAYLGKKDHAYCLSNQTLRPNATSSERQQLTSHHQVHQSSFPGVVHN